MRFERADDEILVAEGSRIIRGGHVYCLFRAVAQAKFQAAFLDGLEVRATRDHTDVLSGCGQADGQVAPDRAGSIDTEFHKAPSTWT